MAICVHIACLQPEISLHRLMQTQKVVQALSYDRTIHRYLEIQYEIIVSFHIEQNISQVRFAHS